MMSPRCGHSAVTLGNQVLFFGGSGGDGGFVNDLYAYDPAADRWEKLARHGEIPTPRGGPLPLSTDGRRIYLFSGAQSAAQYGTWINGDLYVYDVTENAFAKRRSSVPW